MKAIDDRPEGPNAFIQWKGTDVCMDAYCICGVSLHIDDDFAYFLKCLSCGRVYEVGVYVKLYEIAAEDATCEPRFERIPEDAENHR